MGFVAQEGVQAVAHQEVLTFPMPGGGHWLCPLNSQAVAQTKPLFTVPLLIPLKNLPGGHMSPCFSC